MLTRSLTLLFIAIWLMVILSLIAHTYANITNYLMGVQ